MIENLPTSYTMVFCNEQIHIFTDSEEINDKNTIPYKFITKVYETNKNIYLLVDRSSLFFIDKGKFINGSPEELREMLLDKFENKYIICKRLI